MSTRTSVLLAEALPLIRSRGGVLPDDTYLEKVATAAADRVAGHGDANYVRWGLRDFIEDILLKSDRATEDEDDPLTLFALNLLLKCSERAASARAHADDVCRRLILTSNNGHGSALTTSACGLDLAESSLSRLGLSWALQVDLPTRILHPAWERLQEGEETTTPTTHFWRKSLKQLTKTFLAKMLSSKVNATSEEGVGGFLRRFGQDLLPVFNQVLKDLLVRNREDAEQFEMERAVEMSRYISKDTSKDAAECEILMEALMASPVAAKLPALKRALEEASETLADRAAMLRTLETAAVVARRRPELVKRSAPREGSPLQNALLRQEFDLRVAVMTEGPSRRVYERAADLAARCLAEAATIQKESMGFFFARRTKSKKSPSSAAATFCLSVVRECLVADPTVARAEDWDALAKGSTCAGTKEKSAALRAMAAMAASPAVTSRRPKQLLGGLWKTSPSSVGKGDWGEVDDLVSLTTVVLRENKWKGGPVDNDDPDEDEEFFLNLSLGDRMSADPCSYVRAGAFDLAVALLEGRAGVVNRASAAAEAALLRCLEGETEAVARRSAARLARNLAAASAVTRTRRGGLVRLLLGFLGDLDPDVRREALRFFRSLLPSSSPSRIKDLKTVLESDGLGAALTVATRDLDFGIRREVAEMLDRPPLDALGRAADEEQNGDEQEEPLAKMARIEKSEDRDGVLEDVVGTSDIGVIRAAAGNRSDAGNGKADDCSVAAAGPSPEFSMSALAAASRRFRAEFRPDEAEDFVELHTGLDSVLEDIVQSLSPDSALDGLDCV